MSEDLIWIDSDSRRWSTKLKFDDVVRLRDAAGIDLLNPESIELVFSANPLTRIEAMGELARPQWSAAGIEYKDFAEALVSTNMSFKNATDALRRGIADFFRRLGREDLAIVLDRAWDAFVAMTNLQMRRASGDKVTRILHAAMERSERESDQGLDDVLGEILGSTSGSSSGSAESTGDR